jgi:3-dehydroquinate dehydratase II
MHFKPMSQIFSKLLLINGPNLNLLGTREPEIYGRDTLADVELAAVNLGAKRGVEVLCFQSNHEGALIDRLHAAQLEDVGYIVINPAGLSHTSVCLRDALVAVNIAFIEVHISNIHKRESFRHHSYLSDVASGVVVGLGVSGYTAALNAALDKLLQPVSV